MIACKRCGRPLRSEKSREVGIGATCKKKQAAEDAEFERIQMNIYDILTQQDGEGQANGKTSIYAENDTPKDQPCQSGHAAAHDWHSRRYRDWIKREHGMEFEEHLAALQNDIMNKD